MTDDIGTETDGCDLGDQRLNARYKLLLERLGDQPQRSIPAACRGEAEVEGAYRFFDHPAITPDRLLAPHQAATRRRMAEQTCVVVAQDTTAIDLTRKERVVGGPLAADNRCGFFCHLSLAVTTTGVPLGVLASQTWSRDPETVGQSKANRKSQSIDEKESYRWIEGYRACCAAARSLPGVELIRVSDREADIYELFVEATVPDHAAKFLVRACQNRRLAGEGQPYLRASVAATAVLGTRIVRVSERPAKPSETRTRRTSRSERDAVLTIQATTVTRTSPHRTDGELPPVTVTVVLAREVNPPAGEEAIEWLRVTDLAAATRADAERVLDLYPHRWPIAVSVRVLKSGCGVEQLQLETAARFGNALTVYQIVAWRVLPVTMLGRACPALPCETVLTEAEWKAVYLVVVRKPLPTTPPTLGAMDCDVGWVPGPCERPTARPEGDVGRPAKSPHPSARLGNLRPRCQKLCGIMRAMPWAD